ncbi:insulinase family protein [Pantoea sp. Tr-811]|uniref:M16 family metallopeptidase n=1 Tax=Pantoea sp. Tr-811 TaxID=2608361 RepID=UPI0014248EDD|nr:pitrilysin family protein [Pantoea sp. Tr-811]NIF25617.1 insulinase family protein [Pantoea sp. Tr-811]
MTDHPAPSGAEAPIQAFSLANGLRVYLREDHRAPLVSVQLWYHVGSSHEPDGHTGLSHALEHLLFEGSSKLPSGEYAALMARLGGDPNAFTQEDATVFPLTLPSRHVEIALEAMADSMATATLGDAPFTRELAVVMAERRNNVDSNPLALALEQHQALAHGSSRYATPVIGHQADLAQITPAAARTWYQTWYHPNNATLCVAGDIGLRPLQERVARHFAAIPSRRLPDAPAPQQPHELARRSHTVGIKGLHTGAIISFNLPSQPTAPSRQHAYAMRLLPDLLGLGHASTLQRQLVIANPVLQSLNARYEPYRRGDSLLTLFAFCNPQVTPQHTAEQVMAAIETFRQQPTGEEDLQRAKARLLTRQLFARDDIAEQARVIGLQAACGLDPLTLDDERQAIEAVTAEHIGEVAQAYLSASRATLTLMHNPESSHE